MPPQRRSALASTFRSANQYLELLVPKYLAVNRDGLYECTEYGRQALAAYDGILERGLVTEAAGVRETDLSMLRELGDGNYKAPVSRRSRSRIQQRLIERGFAVEGGVTDEGRKVLELTAALFELAKSLHAYPKAA